MSRLTPRRSLLQVSRHRQFGQLVAAHRRLRQVAVTFESVAAHRRPRQVAVTFGLVAAHRRLRQVVVTRSCVIPSSRLGPRGGYRYYAGPSRLFNLVMRVCC
jgi:hypothetical protein